MIYREFVKPLLFKCDPEKAHEAAMELAQSINNTDWLAHFITDLLEIETHKLQFKFRNLHFKNPIGLAAGFDKNGTIPHAISALGFGFTEIGSITAHSSPGNSRPRLFRLPDDNALINRMGLNNDGAFAITQRLKNSVLDIPFGINISKTHDPEIVGSRAIEDYVHSFLLAESVADYLTINISCPNTREGKTFEDPKALAELLAAVDDARTDYDLPVLIKVSADLNRDQLNDVTELSLKHRIDGFIATNTSVQRSELKTPKKRLDLIGNGGLSGAPLYNKMLQSTKIIREIAGDDVLIISVGGIDSPQKIHQCLQSGANLIQVYTALVYNGPFWVRSTLKKLQSAVI